jgi:hypothetical protein
VFGESAQHALEFRLGSKQPFMRSIVERAGVRIDATFNRIGSTPGLLYVIFVRGQTRMKSFFCRYRRS